MENALSVIVPSLSLIFTACSLLYQVRQNLRQRRNETRPIIFASVFAGSNIYCSNRKRSGYSRLILDTEEYKDQREKTKRGSDEERFVFIRLRNTTDNAAYNVTINIIMKCNKKNNQYSQQYTLDTIKGATEILFFIPTYIYNDKADPFIDITDVIIEYCSLSDEIIHYHYTNHDEKPENISGNKTGYKIVNHKYHSIRRNGISGKSRGTRGAAGNEIRFKKKLRGFSMDITADCIKSFSVDELSNRRLMNEDPKP